MNQAQQEAEELSKDFNIPIQVETVCQKLSDDDFIVTYHEQDISTKGFEGISLGDSNGAGIIVNSRIHSYERRRFTAMHEIGHVTLHIFTGMQNSFKCSAKDISTGSNSLRKYEKEANDFASSLLLPERYVKPLVRRNDLVWSFIKDVSEKHEASLQATVRRLISLASEEYAVLIQYDSEVWYPIKSPSCSYYIEKNIFPNNLIKTEIINDVNFPDSWNECDASEWITNDVPFDTVKYSSIYYADYKLTMTVLFMPEVDTWEEANDDWDEPHF